MSREVIDLFTDGGSRGNPGPSAIGVVVVRARYVIHEHASPVKPGTNNEAEYTALLCGLIHCRKHHSGATVICHMDSKLVHHQVTGLWRVRKDSLRQLRQSVTRAAEDLLFVDYRLERRSHPMIARADLRLNLLLDRMERRAIAREAGIRT